ncbi:histidine phosphatase family protein [Bacillus sinesaloumensis]|uniref:histidine phosphatase family protein n=1 Tax=Litchfieldia sinesaloumensis TaxID=1926280 RepID=UPI0009887798|nr:phosphoglycerate mutase family protein [Bacillus sinesaloumensis]
MELTLIRHLPTRWNELGVLQGSKDIPILEVNDTNKLAIDENKQKLKQKYSLVLTSTLIRTQQTAKAYGYEDFKLEPLLNELNFGEYEGKEKKLLIDAHSSDWFSQPRKLELGERLVDLENRMLTFIKKYKQYESILVFGHGSWIRACLSHYRYGTINKMNQFEIKNNQLLTIEVREEEFEIERYHL